MKTIYIGFSSPINFKIGAELIKEWTRSNYSHVYMRFENESLGLSTVYQASHGMVHFMEYENFLKINKCMKEYKIVVNDKDYKELLIKCIKLLGEPYGYVELLVTAFYDVCNTLHIKFIPKDGKGYYCAELISCICSQIFNIQFDKPAYLLCPQDLDNKLKGIYG